MRLKLKGIFKQISTNNHLELEMSDILKFEKLCGNNKYISR